MLGGCGCGSPEPDARAELEHPLSAHRYPARLCAALQQLGEDQRGIPNRRASGVAEQRVAEFTAGTPDDESELPEGVLMRITGIIGKYGYAEFVNKGEAGQGFDTGDFAPPEGSTPPALEFVVTRAFM